MSGQALARHDVAPVIHPHRVKHVLCDIDPEDVHLVLHGTRLLWLNRFTDRELIVAHRRRSAQGRVHFITTVRRSLIKKASVSGFIFARSASHSLITRSSSL